MRTLKISKKRTEADQVRPASPGMDVEHRLISDGCT